MRRRDCAFGAARRWKPRISRNCCPGLIGRTALPRRSTLRHRQRNKRRPLPPPPPPPPLGGGGGFFFVLVPPRGGGGGGGGGGHNQRAILMPKVLISDKLS